MRRLFCLFEPSDQRMEKTMKRPMESAHIMPVKRYEDPSNTENGVAPTEGAGAWNPGECHAPATHDGSEKDRAIRSALMECYNG